MCLDPGHAGGRHRRFGSAGRDGRAIKSGSALERLAQVKAFAFDKTGTISEGKLELGEVRTMGDVSPDELLRWAASGEQRSEHPIARLILAAARSAIWFWSRCWSFKAHPGAGIRATTQAGVVLVGSRRLLEENGVVLPDETQTLIDASTLGPNAVAGSPQWSVARGHRCP